MKTILQTACVVMVTCGIMVEIYYGANIGFVLITAGGLAFGISTKISDRNRKKDLKGGDNNGKRTA